MKKKFNIEKVNYSSSTKVICLTCNLQEFSSVKEAVEQIEHSLEPNEGIDVLINNAGIAFHSDTRTIDGFDLQIQVNQLSHFLLTKLLFNRLKKASRTNGESRIIMHTSSARTWVKFDANYFIISKPNSLGASDIITQRYSQSKLANCLFITELNKRLGKNSNIFGVIADPGFATTNVLEPLQEREEKNGLFGWYKFIFNFMINFLSPKQSASDGTMPLIAAAFHKDTKQGDLLIPKGLFNIVGLPMKGMKNGKSNWWFYGERNVRDLEASQKLWKLCEDATGVTFDLK